VKGRQEQMKNQINMKTSNQVQMVGRLGADPLSKEFKTGKRLTRFSLAVPVKYVNKAGEKMNGLHWHRVSAWNGLSDIAWLLLRKGSQVKISGRIKESWFTNSEGKKCCAREITATDIYAISTARV
jgi:single-strand DNA-binding protein